MAEWANLPKDLIESIFERLETSIDELRFRSVCSTWRSSAYRKPDRLSGCSRILSNAGISNSSLGFQLSKRSIFLIGLPLDPGSGVWLVKIDENDPQKKRLLNPLSRQGSNLLPDRLPKLLDLIELRVFELGQEYTLHHVNYRSNWFNHMGDLYMEKVVMIWLESENLFFLMTIHVSGKLAMFNGREGKWTIIQDMPSPYDDVIAYKGRFFAVDNTGRTVIVGLNSVLDLAANPVFGGDKKYLVESNGELLLVDMYLSIDTGEDSVNFGEEFLEHLIHYMNERAFKFKVFKLEGASQSWIEMKSLGDRVLFLGDDSTFSALASDLPGCKGNCILFVNNFFHGDESEQGEELVSPDIGVFELDTGNIGPLTCFTNYSKLFWPPPHWLTST